MSDKIDREEDLDAALFDHLAEKLAGWMLRSNLDANFQYYLDKYQELFPIVKIGNVIYPIEFREGYHIKKFIREQHEYRPQFNWKELVKSAMKKIEFYVYLYTVKGIKREKENQLVQTFKEEEDGTTRTLQPTDNSD